MHEELAQRAQCRLRRFAAAVHRIARAYIWCKKRARPSSFASSSRETLAVTMTVEARLVVAKTTWDTQRCATLRTTIDKTRIRSQGLLYNSGGGNEGQEKGEPNRKGRGAIAAAAAA
eukprot:6768393-Pyramimonas_sp.AAC.1